MLRVMVVVMRRLYADAARYDGCGGRLITRTAWEFRFCNNNTHVTIMKHSYIRFTPNWKAT